MGFIMYILYLLYVTRKSCSETNTKTVLCYRQSTILNFAILNQQTLNKSAILM